MDSNNISCPVCTLYLRPGITLKNHLSSHPKQKVIEALVRLSETGDIEKIGNSSNHTEGSSISSVNTAIVNQTWNQGNLVNMPPSIPSVQGNHLFIYQQSMSTTTPQQNVLNVNPPSQQYVIPTILNPQMMPYIYQQQVIMSSGSCLSPMRSLPFELPPSTSQIDNTPDHADCSTTEPSSSESDQEPKKIEEIEDVNGEPEQSIALAEQESEIVIEKSVCVESIKTDCDIQEQLNSSLDLEVYDMEELPECPETNEAEQNYAQQENVESPQSPAGSESSFKGESDLNKACQTQNTNNLSPASVLQEEEVLEEVEVSKQQESDFYFMNEGDNHPGYTSVELGQNYDTNPIYTASNILQSTDHLDFVDMEGMHVVINEINDFSTSQIISQVENFEGNGPDRPGVLMTIGGMIDNSKDDFLDQRDAEESMSRESSNVNIRADERMPPRGELSGQESIGGSSDITWNRVQYNEGSSGMSTSYDLLARENWEASDSSDVEIPPLQSRIPPHVSYPEEDNDTPTVVSYTGPPLNFKCSSCDEAFSCLRDRQEHEAEKHPEKAKKINRIGSEIGKSKVKKLIVKLKTDKTEPENFDNVFTNKLKIETAQETENIVEVPNVEDPVVSVKTDENVAVELKTVCPICDCVLLNAKALREHKMSAHNVTAQTRHKCMTCDQLFPNDYKFSEHLRIHPLECKICGRLFYRRQNIQLHMRRHLGIKPYKCDVCGKSFLTKQKLDEHRNIHTGDAPIKCPLCDETFRRHSNLVQHRNRHHLNLKKKVKDYICFCKEVFHSKKKLAWHKEIHDAKPKSCTHCNEKFIHMSSLTRHMRRAHNDRFLPNGHKHAENVECPICKGVYLKSSLEVHIRNHSGQRPYACLICNKDFTTKWNLKLHKWTHASRVSKPFKCDQCKGAFIRESDYIAHMNSHKSIRPYTCNHCGAQFIRKYNCQRHVKEHENEKMFCCKVCGKNFHRSYYLKDHMRIHSGLRPYSCHICGKTSTTKSNHNKHVQIHHAREPVSTEN